MKPDIAHIYAYWKSGATPATVEVRIGAETSLDGVRLIEMNSPATLESILERTYNERIVSLYVMSSPSINQATTLATLHYSHSECSKDVYREKLQRALIDLEVDVRAALRLASDPVICEGFCRYRKLTEG